MPIGAALRGFGAILKGGKRSPTISSVRPSVHTTKKAQKTQRMKEQFDKQMSRTRSDRRMGKAAGGLIAKIGKEGIKYLKNNPDKVKKIMDSDLPKKTKDLLSKLKKTSSKNKKD